MPTIIDAKSAVKIAMDYYEEVSGERTKITVEEIELEEHENTETFWLVTLGIVDPFSIGRISPNTVRTDYKIFKISALTGEVKSMKIRKI